MISTGTQPLRHITYRIVFGLFVVFALAFSLAACGDSAPAQTSTSGGTSAAPAAGDATSVTITEQTGDQDIYAFAPLTVTIKAGGALKIVNNSDENHKLALNPAGPTVGTVTRSGSNDNTAMITFPTAGTYTLTSTLVQRADKDKANEGADSKATLTVTVQ